MWISTKFLFESVTKQFFKKLFNSAQRKSRILCAIRNHSVRTRWRLEFKNHDLNSSMFHHMAHSPTWQPCPNMTIMLCHGVHMVLYNHQGMITVSSRHLCHIYHGTWYNYWYLISHGTRFGRWFRKSPRLRNFEIANKFFLQRAVVHAVI